jgi:hypothetical protein
MANIIRNELTLEGRGARQVCDTIISAFETRYEIPVDRLDDEPLIRAVGKRWPLEIVELTEDKVNFIFHTRWAGIDGHIYNWAKNFPAVRFTYRFSDLTDWQPGVDATWKNLKMYNNAGELLDEDKIQLEAIPILEFAIPNEYIH